MYIKKENLCSKHFLYCIPWKRIKEHSQEGSKGKNKDYLHNGPLVVMPDDVPD